MLTESLNVASSSSEHKMVSISNSRKAWLSDSERYWETQKVPRYTSIPSEKLIPKKT